MTAESDRDEQIRRIVAELYDYQERILALTKRLRELTSDD